MSVSAPWGGTPIPRSSRSHAPRGNAILAAQAARTPTRRWSVGVCHHAGETVKVLGGSASCSLDGAKRNPGWTSWLKDEDGDNGNELPEPMALAQEAMGELKGAIEDLRAILAELGEEIEEVEA